MLTIFKNEIKHIMDYLHNYIAENVFAADESENRGVCKSRGCLTYNQGWRANLFKNIPMN